MNSTPRRLSMLLACALSSTMLYLGTGLTPLPWLTWLAPLPVFLLAPRVSWWAAALAAFGCWTVGGLNLWTYLTGDIGVPVQAALTVLIRPALVFTIAVLVARALMRRGRLVLASLAVPSLWVSFEYLFSLTSADGAFSSLSYTQTDVLPVVQLAAVTGCWGITFLVLAVPAAVASLISSPKKLAAAMLVLLIMGLGYGTLRLVTAGSAGETVKVALLKEQPDYVRATEEAVRGGARIVVWPEAVMRSDPQVRAAGATVIAGIGLNGYNTARVFDGDKVVDYHKQHLLHEPFQPGHDLVIVGHWGVAIGKDMDFPELTRQYRNLGAELMLVPAADVGRDAWLHSRMAIMRGVENGFTVARNAKNGLLTISDSYGRVVSAEAPTHGESTLYTRFGPWFAWLCMAVSIVVVAAAVQRRPHCLRQPWIHRCGVVI